MPPHFTSGTLAKIQLYLVFRANRALSSQTTALHPARVSHRFTPLPRSMLPFALSLRPRPGVAQNPVVQSKALPTRRRIVRPTRYGGRCRLQRAAQPLRRKVWCLP
jgi:hypothetical protein